MPEDPSRRRFLSVACKAGVVLAAPGWLAACSGGLEESETFVEPARLVSKNGELDVVLEMAYAEHKINDQVANLRSFVIPGQPVGLPAPTLQISAGDKLRIQFVNNLPANPPSTEPVQHLRYPNSANLHTHGLHVTPGLVSPGVYGDYVVDDPNQGVQPGQQRQHEFDIGAGHPPGTYWYHPHLHGSTAMQLGSGMAGALIVTGAVDSVPEIAAARERLFVFQAPIFNGQGQLESFSQVASPTAEQGFLINGVRQPVLMMRPGEVQKWRFLNAGIADFVNLSLDSHTLNLYAFDGNPRSSLKPYSGQAGQGLTLAPSNRADVLVKAGAPGTYYLRTLQYNMGNSEPLAEDILAKVIVTGAPLDMALPGESLPVPAALAPISDEELAAHGGLKRNIVMRAVFNENGAPVTQAPAANVLDIPSGELSEWVYQTDNTFMADTVFAMGSSSENSSTAPGMPDHYYPFQSSAAFRQLVALGSVEEWTVFNMNTVQHPFHIHVNPFQVVGVNGVRLAAEDQYWADTIALPAGGTSTNPTSITFRTRFTDFAGLYVMHCHILAHEDMGMMQLVDVI